MLEKSFALEVPAGGAKVGKQRRAKPFLKWAGGKSRLLDELLARVPRNFDRYVEPMIGGGALFFALEPERSLIRDVNPDLINSYKVVQNDVEELIADLGKHRHEQEYYYQIRAADRADGFLEWSDVRRASRTIFLNKTCFNGLYRVNSKGKFNVPFGRYVNPRIVDADNLHACNRALKNTVLTVAPFDTLLESVAAGDFVYFDPPYVPLTKTSSFASYSSDGFSLDDQIRLRDLLVDLDRGGIKFMLSNSYTDATLELYEQFKVETVVAPRAINSKAAGRGNVREIIVRNYES